MDVLRIRQYSGQLGNDRREGESELSRSTEGHSSQELDRSLLGSPLLLLETLKERGENDVNAVSRKSGHDDLGSVLRSVSDIGGRVSEGGEEEGEDAEEEYGEGHSESRREKQKCPTHARTYGSNIRPRVADRVLEGSERVRIVSE